MKRTAYILGILVAAILAGCDSDGASTLTTQSSGEEDAAIGNGTSDPLEGTWHTEFTCREMVKALEQAGVPRPDPDLVQDEFGLDQRPSQTDPCTGVDDTAVHTLRFAGDHFALFAGEELGWEGSYDLVDENTFVTGPSEVLTFDFRIESDKLYTQIVKPMNQAPYIATWESAPWEREA